MGFQNWKVIVHTGKGKRDKQAKLNDNGCSEHMDEKFKEYFLINALSGDMSPDSNEMKDERID